MKKKLLFFKYFIILSIFLLTGILGCGESEDNSNLFYRDQMRSFVENISLYAKQKKPGFIIIPQNGHELLTTDGNPYGEIASKYISSIDGVGREDLFYGYNNDNEVTPQSITDEIIPFLDIAKNYNLAVLVTDYCWDTNKIDDSYSKNSKKGYISFSADHRALDDIPTYPTSPYSENTNDVIKINNAKNFLYLINPDSYSSKQNFLNALKSTNYDLLIIDLFFNGVQLTSDDVAALKVKQNGGSRLVVCYMSIGEAEDYRYYWKNEWNNNPPDWLLEENPYWPGNYKVKYWESEWQNIIYGSDSSYVDKIISTGFDGAYLDIIDAYEYFEDN